MTPTPTPTPEVAQAAATLDPTALALLSIFGGVVLTVVAGLFGAWIQSRREHKKWLREQRYEAFANFLVFMKSLPGYGEDRDRLMAEMDAAEATRNPSEGLNSAAQRLAKLSEDNIKRLREVSAPVNILGPSYMDSTLNEQIPHILSGDADATAQAEEAVIFAMRKSIGVKD